MVSAAMVLELVGISGYKRCKSVWQGSRSAHGPALLCRNMTELHRVSGEKRAAAAASKPAGVECQPNAAAPLLRDEKARREWVEHELDMCCQVSTHRPSHLQKSHGRTGAPACHPDTTHCKGQHTPCRKLHTAAFEDQSHAVKKHASSQQVACNASDAAQSFELARVLDGEKAMRAEAARRKADVGQAPLRRRPPTRPARPRCRRSRARSMRSYSSTAARCVQRLAPYFGYSALHSIAPRCLLCRDLFGSQQVLNVLLSVL